MADPITVKMNPLPPAEVRKALDSVMGPVREAYDAAVATAEAQVLALLRDLPGTKPEVDALELLNNLSRPGVGQRDGNGSSLSFDEVAQIVALDLEAERTLLTHQAMFFRLGPWGPCGECGEPTRAVTRFGGRHVHMLCFDQVDREHMARFDREADRDEAAIERGRTSCPTCLRMTYVPEEGRCMVPTCERWRRVIRLAVA